MLVIIETVESSGKEGSYNATYHGYYQNHPKVKGAIYMYRENFQKKAKWVQPEDKQALEVWYSNLGGWELDPYLRYNDNLPKLFSFKNLNIWLCIVSFIMFLPSITYILTRKRKIT